MKNLFVKLSSALLLCTMVLLIPSSVNAAGNATLTVKTKYGMVKGALLPENICCWKGIRYAKAPVGDLRFRAPQEPDSWQGVKDALSYSPVAPQMRKILVDNEAQGEDCLALNIWSPAADNKKRPVMVWIHGGGFVGGSGSSDLYDGTELSKKGDVVIVTINYRLGPLGFLYFNKLAGGQGKFDNNLGIRDQVAALKWVKENIAAFGGDPDMVTIFGESAGGISVETLMAVPAAKGLFKRAIVESGPATDVWTAETATALTKLFLQQLGVPPDSLQLLKSLPVDSFNSAMRKTMKVILADPALPKTFAPTVDGEFLPHDPIGGLKAGVSSGVDLLIGTNKNEANLFARKGLRMAPVTEEQLKPYLNRFKPEQTKPITAAYKKYPSRSAILDLITDGFFMVPSVKFAEIQSAQANTYMYRFDWTSVPLKAVGLKCCHGLELPFVFHSFNSKLGKKVLLLSNKKKIFQLSAQMQQAWLNFARTGNPNAPGKDDWKKYNTKDRATLIFDRKIYSCNDPKSLQRNAWADISFF